MMVKALVVAGTIGSALQLAMVLTGHQVLSMQDWYGPGGMALSLLAGVIYARISRGSSRDVVIGGSLAGGICALIGIGVSYLLGDVPSSLLLFGTVASAVAGAVGAAVARAIR